MAPRGLPSDATAEAVDVAVVGGGMAGLAAADTLHARGLRVRVFEAAAGAGGLSRSINVGGEEIEAYYHHIFPQDRELRDLIDRLGLSDDFEWRAASTGVLDGGRLYPFDSPLDLLRFGPLPVLSRVRLGLGTGVAMVRGRGRRVDRVAVGDAGPSWFGAGGYAVLWQPLLEGKFGPYAHDVAVAWLVSRLKQRANARKRGTGDRLGYLRGGVGTLAARYEAELLGSGVVVSHGSPVESIVADGNLLQVSSGGEQISARSVVACLSGPALVKVAALPEQYRRSIEQIPYRGVVCVLLELDRALGRHYWVNLIDRTELGCLAVIEHTNFIPAERYGGRHLVYLTHYVDVDGRAWSAGVDEIVEAAAPAMRAINPQFEPSWIKASHLSRDRWAQPVPLAGGPMPDLPLETGLPGLFHASLAHIYPDDRGVSLALRLGRRVGDATAEWLAAQVR
jgi:protoporphyrinogen oxidase